EDVGDPIKILVAGPDDRTADMNRVRQFIVRCGVSDIRRHNEDGYTALGQRRLTGGDSFAASLLRRQDHLAKDAAALVHLGEVDLLNALETQIAPHDLRGDEDDRRTIPIGLIEAVDEVQASRAAASF